MCVWAHCGSGLRVLDSQPKGNAMFPVHAIGTALNYRQQDHTCFWCANIGEFWKIAC